MTTTKKHPSIAVRTVPNGYTLSVGEKEYMCFTAEQLVSEIFVRLALGDMDYMHKDMIQSLLEVAAAWPTLKDAHTANARLKAETKEAQKGERLALKAQENANERASHYKRDLEKITRENRIMASTIERLEIEVKRYEKIYFGDKKPQKKKVTKKRKSV